MKGRSAGASGGSSIGLFWKMVGHWLTLLRSEGVSPEEETMIDIPELTAKQLARAISARVRKRLMLGEFESGEDFIALRRFVGLTQARFAQAMGISVHTLRN